MGQRLGAMIVRGILITLALTFAVAMVAWVTR